MASSAQIRANRQNSLKSTGPTSPAGKAACRLNALKSGIYAESTTIPGEDPAELADLADSYHHRFQPADPVERFLVDALIDADWKLRRYRKVETSVWRGESDPETGFPASPTLAHLHRRMDVAERSYYRALKELKICGTGVRPTAETTLQPAENPASQPEIGSVSANPQAAAPTQPEPPKTPPPTPPDCIPVPNDPSEFHTFHPITTADWLVFDRNPELAAKLHKPWNPTSRSGR